MTSVHLAAVGTLVLLIVVATLWSVNMGALAFLAAFGLGTFVLGLDAGEILVGFPAELFVVLVGVTYLFCTAQRNGTVDWFLHHVVRVVGGRAGAIPWVFFLLTAALCVFGAAGAAVVAILMPMAMSFATTYRIRPLLMGIMLGLGNSAGAFSPIGIFGVIVGGVAERNAIGNDEWLLFGAAFAASAAAAVAAYVALGGTELAWSDASAEGGEAVPIGHRGEPRGGDVPGPAGAPSAGSPAATGSTATPTADRATAHPTFGREQACTVGGFGVVLVGALLLGLDVGFLALSVAVLLTLLFPRTGRSAESGIAWSVVFLIAGVSTYVGLLSEAGTISWLGDTVASTGSALVAALLVCVIGAIVSAFASTTGILGALLPLAVPLIATGEVAAVGLVVALAISSSLVDVSPFSTGGALAIANTPEPQRAGVYRGLLLFAITMMVVGPLVTWLVLVVPGVG
ncbi:SLC13 family permease [Pseudonocardia halophobica]|uniref:SLC13 family permease n=1 Tax=Pseudonocardia halophobica TaxID=29401 RepID=UPI003D8C813E